MLTQSLIDVLRSVDTPTICNALELATGGRSAHGFTYGTLIAAPCPMTPMLGFARTARIRAMAPASDTPQQLRARRLAYYRYVASTSPLLPTLVVMQDLDPRPGTGSFWGEVNSAVHLSLGVAGVLTNGSVRDLGDLAPTFPILAVCILGGGNAGNCKNQCNGAKAGDIPELEPLLACSDAYCASSC